MSDNPHFWIDVVRTQAHTTDCREKTLALTNAAEAFARIFEHNRLSDLRVAEYTSLLRDEKDELKSSLSAARAEVEALRLLLSRLDDAYCEQGPEMSTSERFEHRKLLIEVRTALQEQPK